MVSRTEKNKIKRNKIKKEESVKKRKRFIVNFIKTFLAVAIIIICLVSYVYYASTSMLEVREYSNTYYNLPSNFHGFKIVQLGDLYYEDNYKAILKTIKSTIDKLKPDIVLFTGGLIHHGYNLTESAKIKLTDFFREIDYTAGKYFVVSSTDNEDAIEILTEGGFKFLDDQDELIYYDSPTPILIHGINEKYDFKYSDQNLFKITLMNDPKNIDRVLVNSPPNIIMAGKTLNGQLRIPYAGTIVFSKMGKYYDKYYNVDNVDIYITGGIGTDNIPVRTFNHPSINFYRLKAK